MSTSLINPQKPRALSQEIPFLKNNQNLEAELEQLLAEGDPSKIALFLEKHPGFLLHHANERIHRRLQAIYAGPPATDELQPAQTRLLQDIEYLYRLYRQLLNLSLPDIYESRREITGDINSLVPKKNERLRLEARNRILRRLIHRHLNEQCQWLKSKEQQISQGLDKALNALFYEGFQIEQETRGTSRTPFATHSRSSNSSVPISSRYLTYLTMPFYSPPRLAGPTPCSQSRSTPRAASLP